MFGAILVVEGLKDHLLSYTMLCLSLITPVATTIVFRCKIGQRWPLRADPNNEQAGVEYDVMFLILSFIGMGLISML